MSEGRVLTEEEKAREQLHQWELQHGFSWSRDVWGLFDTITSLRAEVDAWKPYKYDATLKTIVPEKVLGWLSDLRAEVERQAAGLKTETETALDAVTQARDSEREAQRRCERYSAELVQLREATDDARFLIAGMYHGEHGYRLPEDEQLERVLKTLEAALSTPAATEAQKRWEAMERAVRAARHRRAVEETDFDGDARDAAVALSEADEELHEALDALAALEKKS